MASREKSKLPESTPETLMLGYLCIKGVDNLVEKVNILDRFGLVDSEIATICDCAVQSVRNARQKKSKLPEGNN